MQIKTMEYKKVIFSLIFGIFLISLSSALTYVDRCMDLTIAGEYYQQNASIINDTDIDYCIRVLANNITFDGNGFVINNTEDSLTSIENNNSNILFKNLYINGPSSIGGIFSITIGQNEINNITIRNTTIKGGVGGLSVVGTKLINNLNIIDSNIITGSNSLRLIRNSTITNSNITSLVIVNSTNLTIKESVITKTSSASSVISMSTQSSIILINTTYNVNNNNESVASGSDLTRKWYFNAQANSTLNNLPIANVNVSARDNTNTLIWSVLTGSNGKIPQQELTEYVNNGGTRTYYSNYTITPTLGTRTNNYSLNITDNTFLQMSLRSRIYSDCNPVSVGSAMCTPVVVSNSAMC